MTSISSTVSCEPLVSVVVPVYNVEGYLDECVASIAAQTYRNLEVVLVDDGSTDSCPARCDAWAARDPRVRVIHKENGGLAAARNTGLDAMRGEYVAFVDSDDWVEANYIEVLYRQLREANADLSIVGSMYVYEDGRKYSCYKQGVTMTLGPGEAFEYVNIPGYFGVAVWDKLYPALLLDGIRFSPEVRLCEDYRFTYEVLDRAKTVSYSSEPLYLYRQRQGSLSNGKGLTRELVDAADAMLRLVREKYPEQESYAIFGYLRIVSGAYNMALRRYGGGDMPAEWKDVERGLRDFLNKNRSRLRGLDVSLVRRIQFAALRLSPVLYRMLLGFFNMVQRGRIE